MTSFEKQLWDRLERFTPDMEGTQLTFAKRLARENGWDSDYTERVIDEYKKFIFLCCTAPTPVTPSDPVDQAWHLHLTYTKSYWNDLCKDTLNKDIHHSPTKGGKEEQLKFDGLYTASKDIYLEKFGAQPPADIWHDNEARFSDADYRRVNVGRYWLIPRPSKRLRSSASEILLFLAALLNIQAVGSGVFITFMIIIVLISVFSNKNGKGGKGNGCSSIGSCAGGCASGDSGGDGGGCSGCGGGCGGGD